MEALGITDRTLGAKAEPPQRERAENAARTFERVFVQQMVQHMRSSTGLGDDGIFGGGPGSGTYEDWFDQHMAEHLTSARGIGLASSLLDQWERQGLIQPKAAEAAAQTPRDFEGGIDVRA